MESLNRFNDFVSELKANNSRNYKMEVLEKYKDDEEIKHYLNFIFNPYITSGISSKKMSKELEDIGYDSNWKVLDLLDYICEHNTGSNKEVAMCQTMIRNAPEHLKQLLNDIVIKDISLGIDAKSINKVIKNFIPQFNVMLAERYFENPDKYVPEGSDFYLECKFDGLRCVCINDNNTTKFFTRQGKEIFGLNELAFEFQALPQGYVYDGELLANNINNLSSKDLYRETISAVNNDSLDKRGLIFNCFDMIPIDDFKAGKYQMKAIERENLVHKLLSKYHFTNIKAVDILYQGKDKTQIQKYLDDITNAGGEGVMVKLCDGIWENKRSKYILKCKKFNECEAYVKSLEEGTGKNVGRLGNVVVDIKRDGKYHEVKCGSGFTDDERNYYWAHQDEIIGKVVELKYFEVSNNQQDDGVSLRFPVWISRIRNDKNLDDMSEI